MEEVENDFPTDFETLPNEVRTRHSLIIALSLVTILHDLVKCYSDYERCIS